VENGYATSDLASQAALRAIEDALLSPKDIDLIITSTITPDMLFPSTSCYVQEKIGATRAGAFDVLAACAGFVYALSIGQCYVSSGAADTVLVIGAECLSKITDYTDRTSCILFGDGAGATVLQKSTGRHEILATYLGADGSQAGILNLPAGGSKIPTSYHTVDERMHFIKFRGKEVFKYAINTLTNLIKDTIDKCGLTVDDIDLFIPHQSNFRIIEATMERLGVPMEKAYSNIDRYGNTSSASVPIAIDEASKNGELKPGDIILLATFGGGLTWSSSVIRW
jgi:3-oxoacyl-[acyl-carrier-protein] synthase-3